VLVTPKDSWPPYRRGTGLSMECLGVDCDGAQVFRYVHDADYASAQRAYERAQASHNPTNLVALLRQYPWHVDALLSLSDIYIYTGEGQQSAEMLERCLFALEGAWHPWFAAAAAAGTARMDGSGGCAPNDVLFTAVFKHVQALTRRGCHRAALECAKLALSLDRADPTGLLCCADYFALRCGHFGWLLNFAAGFRTDGQLLSLPGFAFSAALARFGGGRPGGGGENNTVEGGATSSGGQVGKGKGVSGGGSGGGGGGKATKGGSQHSQQPAAMVGP
jgi:tetratricopeptide (TPR) repeat protein